MAGLGLGTQGHLAAVSSDDAAQEALRLLAKALSPPSTRLPTCVGLFAVPAQAYLAHDTLKQRLDIVVQRSRRLNKLAVEDHGTGPALWRGCEQAQVNKQRVGRGVSSPLKPWPPHGSYHIPGSSPETQRHQLLYRGAQASLGHPTGRACPRLRSSQRPTKGDSFIEII